MPTRHAACGKFLDTALKEGRRYVNAPPSSLLLLNATLSIPTTPSDSERYAFHSNFPPFLFPDKNSQVEINVAAASNLIYPQDRSTKYSLLSPALTVHEFLLHCIVWISNFHHACI
ncbi:hypothetical protein MRB53_032672 [Persea americana]|uniref:Uncharacterized protein n=1 Tax=Persea americana TaxID=3435 RepID=A0ACC2KSW2_PERAE|nr:hypothetical protein MRB53_032672 [Persea americana]